MLAIAIIRMATLRLGFGCRPIVDKRLDGSDAMSREAQVVEDVRALRQADVLRQLGEEELTALLMIAERRCYAKGQLIMSPSRDEDATFVIAKGRVRLYLVSSSGRELTLFRWRTGTVFDICGEPLGLGSGAGVSQSEPVAESMVDGTVVYSVPWLEFLKAARRAPEALCDLAGLMRRRSSEERWLIGELAFHGRKARLAHQLAQLAREHPLRIVSETRDVLASMTATWPEDVTRALQQLQGEGLVDLQRHKHRRIVVRKINELAGYET
jgi:CRP-like cAMP-binding protein